MSSAANAELGALFINAREAALMRHLLIEMGHPQPPTPIQVNNTTALGVVKQTIQPKQTKAMDMRFHWLRCSTNQKQFRTYWREGKTNRGDYTTKHHSTIHHQVTRPTFLTAPSTRAKYKAKATNIIRRLKHCELRAELFMSNNSKYVAKGIFAIHWKLWRWAYQWHIRVTVINTHGRWQQWQPITHRMTIMLIIY